MEKLKKIEGVYSLSRKELKSIEGGIMIGVAICLFALGMAIGAGIGNRTQRR